MLEQLTQEQREHFRARYTDAERYLLTIEIDNEYASLTRELDRMPDALLRGGRQDKRRDWILYRLADMEACLPRLKAPTPTTNPITDHASIERILAPPRTAPAGHEGAGFTSDRQTTPTEEN
jgi:hypothetical protein